MKKVRNRIFLIVLELKDSPQCQQSKFNKSNLDDQSEKSDQTSTEDVPVF